LQSLPDIIDALRKLGFVNIIRYEEINGILLLRPLLLERYGKYVEKELPELRARRDELIHEVKSSFGATVITMFRGIRTNAINTDLPHIAYVDKVIAEALRPKSVKTTSAPPKQIMEVSGDDAD